MLGRRTHGPGHSPTPTPANTLASADYEKEWTWVGGRPPGRCEGKWDWVKTHSMCMKFPKKNSLKD